jgi:hypothetical protein
LAASIASVCFTNQYQVPDLAPAEQPNPQQAMLLLDVLLQGMLINALGSLWLMVLKWGCNDADMPSTSSKCMFLHELHDS